MVRVANKKKQVFPSIYGCKKQNGYRRVEEKKSPLEDMVS
jgi:hypothetical protein